MSDQVSLKDYIDSLRTELADIEHDTSSKRIRFGVDALEIELTTQVSNGKEGGLAFHVLTAKASKQSATSQVLRMKLSPYRETREGERKDLELTSRGAE